MGRAGASLGAGVGLELGKDGGELLAVLTASLGEIQGQNVTLQRLIRGLMGIQGTPERINGAVTIPASGNQVAIDCGGPPSGRTWHLMLLNTFGADPYVAVVGNVAVFVGSPAAGVDPGSVVDPGGGLPLRTTFGEKQCMLRNPDHIYGFPNGVAAGTQIRMSGIVMSVTDYPMPQGSESA